MEGNSLLEIDGVLLLLPVNVRGRGLSKLKSFFGSLDSKTLGIATFCFFAVAIAMYPRLFELLCDAKSPCFVKVIGVLLSFIDN